MEQQVERNDRIWQAWNMGKNITEIADHFALARTTIYQLLMKRLLVELPKWTVWADQKAEVLGHQLQAPWKMPRQWHEEAVTSCALCGYKARITNRLALRGNAVKSKCKAEPLKVLKP